ncbi:amidase domain-containing protein [Terrisporobacter petrolearius]|uniref:amidase domain-containing protein n=1 Tax=Terrisporobacter petrolearius TaxID=1460447 RepID=UPI003B007315
MEGINIKLKKILKKSGAFILTAMILLGGSFSNIKVFGNEVTTTKEENINKSKIEDNLKMEEIQKIFQKYLDENNINIKFGTPEYLEYVYSNMLEQSDKKLLKHPQYDLITAYFAEYIVALQDYESIQKSENAKNDTNKNKFSIENLKNKEKTLEQIQKENIQKEKEIESSEIKESNLRTKRSVRSSSGYSPQKAVKYAHKWANSYNTKYYMKYGADCTNFVSQCLYAGGMKENKLNSLPLMAYPTTKHWYCVRPSVSSSWIRVTDFYSYWSKRSTVRNFEGDTTVSKYGKLGDVVQIRNAKTYTRWHSMIITKKVKGKVYLSGHSRPRYDYAISEIDDYKNDWTLLSF